MPSTIFLEFSKDFSFLGFCSDFCDNIRMDTHEDNKIMQHLLEKNGFIRCGTVHIFNGDPRIAYQKIIAGKENK